MGPNFRGQLCYHWQRRLAYIESAVAFEFSRFLCFNIIQSQYLCKITKTIEVWLFNKWNWLYDLKVQQAISEYLKVNTIDGCSDRNNINFNPQANYDSGKSCDEKLKFGGFVSTFKKCSQYNSQGKFFQFKKKSNIYMKNFQPN